MGKWETVKYSKKKIEKAGKRILLFPDLPKEEALETIRVVDNWRAAHAYPLSVITKQLIKMTENIDSNVVVVQRLKRLDSIILKLLTNPEMSLYRMQDLGGCRVIVPSVGDVYQVVHHIEQSRMRHKIVGRKDYITFPKETGYRGYHIILQYHSDRNDKYNGMRIEIQIRTELQHWWATATETMSVLTNSYLKSGIGDLDYLRYFALVASLFASFEHCPIVPFTPDNKNMLVGKMRELDYSNKIIEKLGTINAAVRLLQTPNKEAAYYLLDLNYRTHEISMRQYKRNEIDKANADYKELEEKRKREKETNTDVVLVSARSLSDIRKGYQNYFLNTQQFISTINELCEEYPEKTQLNLKRFNNYPRIKDMFNLSILQKNIGETEDILFDGIGITRGNLYVCPNWKMRLDDSYLRYSGIICHNRSSEGFIQKGAHHITEPAVVITENGASFLVEKEDWYLVSDGDCLLLTNKYGANVDDLLILLAWMKTDIFTWSVMWRKQDGSIIDYLKAKAIIPQIDISLRNQIIDSTMELLNAEKQFVRDYRNLKRENDLKEEHAKEQVNIIIEEFNDSILLKTNELENLFNNIIKLNDSQKEILTNELLRKGVYSINNAIKYKTRIAEHKEI